MKPVAYQSCIVTFLDILGFRELVAERSAAEVHGLIAKLQEFTKPDDDRFGLGKAKVISQPIARSVSDAILRIRPFETSFRDGALFHEVYDLLMAQVSLLDEGVIIRGGLTVGEVYIPNRPSEPVFGPAMVRAYEIESQEANYPRIVIGDEALLAHTENPQLRAASEDDELEHLVSFSEDGSCFIDYLKGLPGQLDYPEAFFDFLGRHKRLIEGGLARQSSSKVRQKFSWLQKYHNLCVEGFRIANRDGAAEATFIQTYGITVENFTKSLTISEPFRWVKKYFVHD